VSFRCLLCPTRVAGLERRRRDGIEPGVKRSELREQVPPRVKPLKGVAEPASVVGAHARSRSVAPVRGWFGFMPKPRSSLRSLRALFRRPSGTTTYREFRPLVVDDASRSRFIAASLRD